MKTRKQAKEDGDKYYHSDKPCKNGHLSKRRVDSGQCYQCAKDRRKRVYREQKDSRVGCGVTFISYCGLCKKNTEHYSSNGNCKPCANKRSSDFHKINRDRLKVKFSLRYRLNRDNEIESKREFYAKNRDRILKNQAEYRAKNKDKIKKWRRSEKAMKAHRIRQRERLKTKAGKVENFIRSSIHRLVRASGNDVTSSDMGYSRCDLMSRIESTFVDGMSWDNYGEWHIDHIVHVKLFIDEGCFDLSIVNSLSNLRALWAFDNIGKGCKFNGDIKKEIERLRNETKRLPS